MDAAAWRERLRRAQGHLVFYAVLGFSGIAGWVLWNAVIFHAPLYFQDGAFARPSLWVSRGDVAIGHWGLAARTYLYAMADNAGWLALALAAAGLALFVARTRLRGAAVAALPLLVIIPFYVYALYAGQRPLHVTQINGSLYNVRFGVLIMLPVALFTGFLAVAIARLPRALARVAGGAALLAAAAAATALVIAGGAGTMIEPRAYQASPAQRANFRAAAWLRDHYRRGDVLMESFGNETVTFASHIPLREIIYEGSYRQWRPALRDPAARGVRWIYMRRLPGDTDEVYRALHGSPRLAGYALVYADPSRLIYRER
jgi:hypothetical protein